MFFAAILSFICKSKDILSYKNIVTNKSLYSCLKINLLNVPI